MRDGALPIRPKESARKKKEIPLIHSRSSGRSAGDEMREGEKALTQMDHGAWSGWNGELLNMAQMTATGE